MSRNKLSEIVLFAGSPSDVEREREEGVRTVVEEINSGIARERGLHVRPVTWRDITPDLGRAQAVVLDQIGQFDLFVGIMSKQFGSPTGRYESGTEEEFYNAYNLWKATRRPRVMFYFKQALGKMPSAVELEQIDRVLKFKSDVQERGLTSDYDEYDDFVRLFRRHLTDVILHWGEPPEEGAAEQSILTPYWPVWMEAYPKERVRGIRTETWLYSTANSSVKFMTISGRSIYSGDVEEILRERSRAGFQVKLLLFDWNSPWFPAKMRDERRETDEAIELAREKARAIAHQMLMLGTLPNLQLDIRLYREYPAWRLMIVDNHKAFLGYYPPGKRGYEGPMFVFEKGVEGSLFYPINQYFDRLWQSSGESLQRDDPRFELRPLREIESPRA